MAGIAVTDRAAGQVRSVPAQGVSAWSSQRHPRRGRYDAWAQVLSEYFLPWSLCTSGYEGFRAAVRQRQIGSTRFLRCNSEPLAGMRSSVEIGRTDRDYYNILYVVSGRERLKFESTQTELQAGQFVLWDSGRHMDFSVLQPLEKLTLMVPEHELRAVLPNAADYVGVALDGRSGLGALFAHHLRQLDRQVWSMPDEDAACVVGPALELFSQACLRAPGRERPHARTLLMQRIRDYVLAHLADPGLTPRRIAQAQRISLRYLHLIFAEQQLTVADWIRQQRLERCRLELINPALAQQSITEIALRWGFSDPGHFGKLFRQRYDMTPRHCRASASANTGAP